MGKKDPNSVRAKRSTRQRRSDGMLTTGDMARLTGSTMRTVRFYEEAGIVESTARTTGGHRLFDLRQLDRLRFVSDLRAAGLSLEQIRQLLRIKTSAKTGRQAATNAVSAIRTQLDSLRETMRIVARLQKELTAARTVLQECCDCTQSRKFPEECDCCEVFTKRQLPLSLRALWEVGERCVDDLDKR